MWPPALPLVIQSELSETSTDNAIAELVHSDRICEINLYCTTTSHVETLCRAMRVPFPELVVLYLSFPSYVPVLPDSFLEGSAPRLRQLTLVASPFPGLPKILLSATHLVDLRLIGIPHSGYISPEVMVTCLSMLTKLEQFQLEFKSSQSSPYQGNQHSPRPTRSTLPALKIFWFKGVSDYLEDLVSRINSPQVYWLSISFFNHIHFDTPEFGQFISRTPTLGAYTEAHLTFYNDKGLFRLQSHKLSGSRMVQIIISCQVPDRLVSSLAQVCTMPLRLLSTIENLYIYEDQYYPLNWNADIELDILLPFIAVKNFYLSKKLAPRIAPALQELTGGGATEVLPALQNVLLEGFEPSGPVQEGIAQFISARLLINHTITVSLCLWDREREAFIYYE